jgi:hypothetical protein
VGSIILMISNYFHDLSVAILASNIFAVYYIGKFLDGNSSKKIIVSNLFEKLRNVTIYALVYIVVAGAVRAYFFMDFEWNPAVGKGQIAALIVKHIILFAVTGFGIVFHVKYQKRYGNK